MSFTGYSKYFYKQYCLNCILDQDKEADPICEDLGEMMDGKKPPEECEGKGNKSES